MPATVFKGDTIIERLRFYILPTHRNDSVIFRLQDFVYGFAKLKWFVPEAIENAASKTILLNASDLTRLNATVRMPQVSATSRKRTTVPMRLTGNLREALRMVSLLFRLLF
jgi:hypothetical protein